MAQSNSDILKDQLKALAEAIRAKTGTTGSLSLDEMFTAINNIQKGGTAEISSGNSLKNKLVSIANAIRAKTGDTSTLSLDEMIEKIENLVLDWSGAVIPSSDFTIGTHNVATRQGNLVTVDVELIPKGSVTANMILFTLPYGCKPKTPITFEATYPNMISGKLKLVCSLNSNGQALTTEDDNPLWAATKLLCQFEFEAI